MPAARHMRSKAPAVSGGAEALVAAATPPPFCDVETAVVGSPAAPHHLRHQPNGTTYHLSPTAPEQTRAHLAPHMQAHTWPLRHELKVNLPDDVAFLCNARQSRAAVHHTTWAATIPARVGGRTPSSTRVTDSTFRRNAIDSEQSRVEGRPSARDTSTNTHTYTPGCR